MERAAHEARTLDAIRAAARDVPFYAKQGLSLGDGDLATSLGALPLLTREKIRPSLPKAWLPTSRDAKTELASGRIAVMENGTGDARVRILFDAGWWRTQERAALALHPRAAAAMRGELGVYKEAVLWVPERGTGSCGAGDPEMDERLEGHRLHLNSRQDPTFWTEPVMTRMLEEIGLHGTIGLFADPFYLDVLARHAATLGRRFDVRGFVALSRSITTHGARSAIGRVFQGTVFQLYGSREAGTLFVEGADGLLHHSPHAAHVELLPARVPTPGAEDVALVVVTTVGREVQPLVRYVLGDLVQVSKHVGATGVPSLVSVEGRFEDAIARPDGAIVTPAAIDRALAATAKDLRGYQVTQRDAGSVDLEVVGDPEAAKDALAALFAGMTITARAATAIGLEPNGKLRTAKRAPTLVSDAFEVAP